MRTARSTALSLLIALLLCAPAWAQPTPPAGQGAALDRWLGQLNRPFIIGLAGDSGSGKSTFATGLQQTLGADRVKIMCVDDYHRLDRQGRKTAGVTALNPLATDLDRLARDLGTLRRGKTIDKPVYDHSNGTLAPSEKFKPAQIIIVEGLHPFATKSLRKQVDLSIYFDPSSRVKESWKVKRDVGERGHTLQAVRKSIRERKPDYKAYVQPQRAQADVLVQFDWSAATQEGLAVKVRHQGQRPVAQRIRVNASGEGFVLRGERRRDGSGVVTLDGRVPLTAVSRLDRLVKRATGVRDPQIQRRSETLDATRLLVASRVMKEIVRKGTQERSVGRAFHFTPRRLRAAAGR